MNRKEIIEAVKDHPGEMVKFAVIDIDGVPRGKTISKSKFLKSLDDDIGFCNVVFGWDSNDAVYDNTTLTGWHTGYPDSEATIDLSTFRKTPWNDDIPFFLADFRKSDRVGDACPRTLLNKVGQECLEMGYRPMFAAEFEWFNFQESPQSLKENNYRNPRPIAPGMFGYSLLRSSQNSEYFNNIYELLFDFDVPVEALHTETGDGVYEASVQYTDILEAADRAVLLKAGVKEIALKHEIVASFMAKWSNDLPGCSGHIHQSLWDEEEGRNLFYDESGKYKMSTLLEYYLAGQLHCLPHILPMYAPTVNSYKRFVEGSWASTSVSWGMENRTTALRLINRGETSARLETRVPGSDANPYLSMAAALASGLYGIQNELSLDVAPTEGNEYENSEGRPLPENLKEAVEAMKSSDIPEALFGETFVDHFIRTREWEWRQYSKQVTDWEVKRYFEII